MRRITINLDQLFLTLMRIAITVFAITATIWLARAL
jgi:hypothetical protein